MCTQGGRVNGDSSSHFSVSLTFLVYICLPLYAGSGTELWDMLHWWSAWIIRHPRYPVARVDQNKGNRIKEPALYELLHL